MAIVALAAAALSLAGCTAVVRYTDELVSARAGRTFVTRTPATFGGVVGFLAGVPIDIAAVPATYLVYATQDEVTRDPLSIFLFPSFVLWRVGTLIGAPFDAVEWAAYRWWQAEDALTPEERERREIELDELEWPDYPVEPIYPLPQRG